MAFDQRRIWNVTLQERETTRTYRVPLFEPHYGRDDAVKSARGQLAYDMLRGDVPIGKHPMPDGWLVVDAYSDPVGY